MKYVTHFLAILAGAFICLIVLNCRTDLPMYHRAGMKGMYYDSVHRVWLNYNMIATSGPDSSIILSFDTSYYRGKKKRQK